MAFPSQLAAPTATTFATSVTSMAVSMPASVTAGNRLIAAVSVRNSGTWNTIPGGWVRRAQQLGGLSASQLTIFEKLAVGNEGGTTSIFVTSTGTTAVWQVMQISGAHPSAAIEVNTTSGDSVSVDPPSLTPSWGSADTLWIEVAGHAAASAAAFTAASSGYSGFQNNGTSSGGGAVSLASAYRQNAAASEDPGAITASGSNRYWATATIAVRPVPSGGGSGGVKVWDGTAFVVKPIKVYNGSTWVEKPVKVWNGSSWVTAGSGGGGIAPAKQLFSMVFSGTIKPSGIIDIPLTTGASNATTMSSGILREGNSIASNGSYYTLSLWGVETSTDFYTSSVTNGLIASTDRAMGPALSNSDGSKVICSLHTGNAGSSTITTFIGGVMTHRFTSTSATFRSSSSTDVMTLVPSVSGGVWTYTVYKNGTALAMSWTDTAGDFGAPGKYPSGMFRHTYSTGQYVSPGIRAYSAADI